MKVVCKFAIDYVSQYRGQSSRSAKLFNFVIFYSNYDRMNIIMADWGNFSVSLVCLCPEYILNNNLVAV